MLRMCLVAHLEHIKVDWRLSKELFLLQPAARRLDMARHDCQLKYEKNSTFQSRLVLIIFIFVFNNHLLFIGSWCKEEGWIF